MLNSQDPIRDVDAEQVNRQTFAQRRVERKPETPPQGNKDYKEIAAKGKKEKTSDSSSSKKSDSNESGPPPSIFDLARHSTIEDSDPIEKMETVTAAAGVSSDKALIGDFRVDEMPSKETLPRNPFMADQPDLSYVNPMGVSPLSALAETVRSVKPEPQITLPRSSLQEMVAQMLDHIHTVQIAEKTDTVLTLKHLPLFAGATVTITTLKTAPHQINIAFNNLTQEAQNILDLPKNIDQLKLALTEKDITVQMITTSAQIENNTIARGQETREGRAFDQGRDPQDGEGKQQQRRRHDQ